MFKDLIKIKICLMHIFQILIIHKPSLVSCEVPQKWVPDRFSRSDVYLDTTRKKVYILVYTDRNQDKM